MSIVEGEDPATHPRPKRGRRRSADGGPTLQHRLEYAGVRLAGAVLRRLPVALTSAAMAEALALVMPRTSRHRRALDNLAYAMPERPREEREAIARGMWRNLGRVSAEAFQIDKLIADPSRVTLPEDFATYERIARDGLIAATAHLGNWEIAGILPRASGIPFAAVYQELHNPLVERYLKSMRAPAYPQGLYTKGARLGQTLVRLARQGVGIGLVADFRELRGVPVTFFGRTAYATPLPAMLARLSGRPLIAGAMLRTRGVRFEVVMRQIPVPVTDDREADVRAATHALHDALETWIRQAPDQWMWSHRKWARARTTALSAGAILSPAPQDDPAAGPAAGSPSPDGESGPSSEAQGSAAPAQHASGTGALARLER